MLGPRWPTAGVRIAVILTAMSTPETAWEALPKLRRIAAQRLEESARTVPVFTLDAGAWAGDLESFRRQLADVIEQRAGTRLSVTHVLVAAVGRALAGHPDVNVNYEERDGVPGVVRLAGTSVGVAVATDRGLLVPAVRDVAARQLPDLVAEIERVVGQARAGRVPSADMGGAALTVSNLGMLGVRRFHAVVNPPESCILAAGAVHGDPPELALSLSCDHRALDGVQAARFLADVVDLVERPYRLLL